MDESQALTIIDSPALILVEDAPRYDDDLAASGQVANQFARLTTFSSYHQECTYTTQQRQHADLALFCTYLAEQGVTRTVEALFDDPEAWRGITHGHLKAFQQWQLNKSYAIGTVNVRMATMRKYCSLAYQSGVIPLAEMDLIRTVKGFALKTGRNIDEDRKRKEQKQRVGLKKADPTPVPRTMLQRLRRAVLYADLPRYRDHDQLLAARDKLLICLLSSMLLRCSEAVALNVEHFNLETNVLQVYRRKTHTTSHLELTGMTASAADNYLSLYGCSTGSLFVGYQDVRLSTRAVNKRVGELGELIGIVGLSPHDLRHAGTLDAINSGVPLDVVQAYGGWSSPAMVLHYVKLAGVAHKGMKIHE